MGTADIPLTNAADISPTKSEQRARVGIPIFPTYGTQLLAYGKRTRSRDVLADESHERPLLVWREPAANHAVAGLWRTHKTGE